MQVEHTLTIWNEAGAAVFQAEVLVGIDITADGWKITSIEDENNNAYDSHFFAACAIWLETRDTLFPHMVNAAIAAQRAEQRSNEIYDAKHGD